MVTLGLVSFLGVLYREGQRHHPYPRAPMSVKRFLLEYPAYTAMIYLSIGIGRFYYWLPLGLVLAFTPLKRPFFAAYLFVVTYLVIAGVIAG